MKSSYAVSSDVSLKSFRISKKRCYSMGQGVVDCCSFLFEGSTIQLNCNKLAIFAMVSISEKLED